MYLSIAKSDEYEGNAVNTEQDDQVGNITNCLVLHRQADTRLGVGVDSESRRQNGHEKGICPAANHYFGRHAALQSAVQLNSVGDCKPALQGDDGQRED